MTVLHYISDENKNSLSHVFLKEMQKGGGAGLVAHVMAACPVDDFVEDGNVTFHKVSKMKLLGIGGYGQFCKILDKVSPDIVHIHSFWDVSAWLVFKWARRRRIPVVVSTYKKLMRWNFEHGYAHSKLPRYVLMQREMLKHASAIHVVTEQELEQMKTVSFHPQWKSKCGLNDKLALVRFAANNGDGADYGRLATQMALLYRKVADSNPFMLMDNADRCVENNLLSLGASLMADVPMQDIYLDVDGMRREAESLSTEHWRRIQLHASNQGILQPIVKAYKYLLPEGSTLNIDGVDRFVVRGELPFLETMRTKDKVARMKQLADDYARYEVERKLCVMFVNVRYLLRHGKLTRRNLADLYLALRYEKYNDYILENMLNEIDMWKFASRMLCVLHDSMNLEQGYIPFKMTNDRNTRKIIVKLFKSNMQ